MEEALNVMLTEASPVDHQNGRRKWDHSLGLPSTGFTYVNDDTQSYSAQIDNPLLCTLSPTVGLS